MPRLVIGQPAPDIALRNSDSATVSLSDAWQDTPVLLSFLRHFG